MTLKEKAEYDRPDQPVNIRHFCPSELGYDQDLCKDMPSRPSYGSFMCEQCWKQEYHSSVDELLFDTKNYKDLVKQALNDKLESLANEPCITAEDLKNLCQAWAILNDQKGDSK